MEIETPQVFLRHNAFNPKPDPITPILYPQIPTHLTLSEINLPLRQLGLSRGLRHHEIAITHNTITVFITPATTTTLKQFKSFVATLLEISISPPNYTFTRLLARGSFGTVHAAITPQQTSLAVKRVPLSNPLWRFERSVLKHLPPHPNLIPVIEMFTTKQYLHIVMPQLSSLSDMPQPLPLKSAVSLIRSLLAAVAHMHKYGVCHNDIKPDNILLVPNSQPPQAVLTDMGLASYGPGRGGTQAFHAPYGSGSAADVWSVGVVAFVLVTGKMPWKDSRERVAVVKRMKSEGSGKVVGELVNETVGDVRGLEDMTALLKGLLQVDARKRLSARAALEHSVFGSGGRSSGGIKRVFKGVLFGIRWLDSLRGGRTVGRTLLL